MSFGWWTIFDSQGKWLSVKNPVALQFTQTGVPGTYYHSQFKGTYCRSFVFPIHPLNGTHKQYLSQGLKILLEPVSSPSSTVIEVD
jgi:hypothetical protein